MGSNLRITGKYDKIKRWEIYEAGWSNNGPKIRKPQKINKNSNMANMKYLKYGKTIIQFEMV